MATGPQTLPENTPTAGVQPPCPVSITAAQAKGPLSPPCPTPHQGCSNTRRIRGRGKAPCGRMWPVPRVASERFCSPQEAGDRETGVPRSNLLPLSSWHLLGTARINGPETQVRAVRKLPAASENRSLWLNEARSWKSGGETAGAFTPDVGDERLRPGSEPGPGPRARAVRKACSVGPGASAGPCPSPGRGAGCFRFVFVLLDTSPHCRAVNLSGIRVGDVSSPLTHTHTNHESRGSARTARSLSTQT